MTVIEIWFDFLKDLSAQNIGQGIAKYLNDPEASQFPPTAAKIRAFTKSLELVTDFKPTPDAIIAAAREPKTPLGVMARIKIGSWDLNSGDTFLLRQRAHEVLQVLPDWQRRASQGDYSPHELKTMAKYQVDPNQAFCNGLPKPNQESMLRIAEIRKEIGLGEEKSKNLSIPTG